MQFCVIPFRCLNEWASPKKKEKELRFRFASDTIVERPERRIQAVPDARNCRKVRQMSQCAFEAWLCTILYSMDIRDLHKLVYFQRRYICTSTPWGICIAIHDTAAATVTNLRSKLYDNSACGLDAQGTRIPWCINWISSTAKQIRFLSYCCYFWCYFCGS